MPHCVRRDPPLVRRAATCHNASGLCGCVMAEADPSRALAEYLAAKARHAEAEWMMRRAEAWFDELAGRFGDDERAYDLPALHWPKSCCFWPIAKCYARATR
jgi:hypothetical protein